MSNCIDKLFCDNSNGCNVRITDVDWNDIETRYLHDGDEIYLSVSQRDGLVFEKFMFLPDTETEAVDITCQQTDDGRCKTTSQCGGTYIAVFNIISYVLQVVPNDGSYGTVYGSGTYTYGTTALMSATSNIGYHFVGWYVDNILLSDMNVFEYVVKGNANIEGSFEPNTYSIVVRPNNNALGITSGTGLYGYGDIITISATPNEGSVFVNWENGETSSSRQIQVLQSAIYVANFEVALCSVSINISCDGCNNLATYGFVTGNGTYEYGSYVTVNAYPNEGFQFDRWESDTTLNSATPKYSFIIESDVEFTAFFVNRMCSLKVTVLPENSGYITDSGNNLFTQAFLPYGSTAILKAVSYGNNEFLKWEDGDTNRVKNFEMITDVETKAYFVTKPNIYSVKANFINTDSTLAENGGTVLITDTLSGRQIGVQMRNYTEANVSEGKSITMTAVPSYGYTFYCWDNNTSDNNNSKTINDIRQNISVYAYFRTSTELQE